jgi:hypothetical protein
MVSGEQGCVMTMTYGNGTIPWGLGIGGKGREGKDDEGEKGFGKHGVRTICRVVMENERFALQSRVCVLRVQGKGNDTSVKCSKAH